MCVSRIQTKAGPARSTVPPTRPTSGGPGPVRATRIGTWTCYRRDEVATARLLTALGDTLRP
ncbi:hypothetical protein AB0C76_28910 [Kitasatospora sp. NPDC048722]|uniref:hypothetical protein n=1 Tax=Kitasatospora sp. NPDC048722 TaxID=3155639 RepID=UPI0033E1AA1B